MTLWPTKEQAWRNSMCSWQPPAAFLSQINKAPLALYFFNPIGENKPQDINLGTMKEFLGPMFVKDFTTKDHDGKIKTATFTTIAGFMKEYNLTDAVYHLGG